SRHGIAMKRFPLILLLAVTLLAPLHLLGAPLASGSYRIQVPLGDALLNGRYPIFVNEGVQNDPIRLPTEGRIDVTTDATGKITGTVEIYAEVANVTGQAK